MDSDIRSMVPGVDEPRVNRDMKKYRVIVDLKGMLGIAYEGCSKKKALKEYSECVVLYDKSSPKPLGVYFQCLGKTTMKHTR